MNSDTQHLADMIKTPVPPRQRFHLYSHEDICALPEPEWLIRDMLQVGAQVVLYGPPGDGKSFLALDFALCVATGLAFHGREVRKGPVIYIVAEGGRGVRLRVHAWQKANGVETLDTMFFVLEAVQMRDHKEREQFLNQLTKANIVPALIVVDTLARCFVGGDENAAKDTGELVDGLRKIQVAAGDPGKEPTILAVHHTTKQKGNKPGTERGSSAIRGAADTMIQLTRKAGVIVVTCDKQKDAEEFDPIRFTLDVIRFTGGVNSDTTSCVLTATDEARSASAPLSDELQVALGVLSVAPNHELKSGKWKAGISAALKKTVADRTFHNWREGLLEDGYVESSKEGWYHLTPSGVLAAIRLPSHCHPSAA